jgi:glycerate kinase
MTDTPAVPRVAGIPQTILIAPDSFKGTLSAAQVVDALAGGVQASGRPVDRCPLADGGEGTLDILVPALGAEIRELEVQDPLGRSISAAYALAGDAAIVETAAASGLGLLGTDERDPMAASTQGTGQLIAAAAQDGARTIYVGVGGSASTDGGAGALRAIRQAGGIDQARLVVLCDVQTPFEDAARVFAPQKGADPEQVRKLSKRLNGMARSLERDPRGVARTGAAGGLAGGLWASYGAELISGAGFVLDTLGFDARMRRARAVITGEGKLDDQSLVGKTVSEVATRCRQAGVPAYAVVGSRELDAFGMRILDLQVVLEAGTDKELRAAGRRLGELV